MAFAKLRDAPMQIKTPHSRLSFACQHKPIISERTTTALFLINSCSWTYEKAIYLLDSEAAEKKHQ
jgi:hypothetical protein